MDDDLAELRALFMEECAENVDALEEALLAMGSGSADGETLDSAFRAAHSIKGGGATFGFSNLAELTHHMEAYLEVLRSEGASLTEDGEQALLESIDLVREMLGDTDLAINGEVPAKGAQIAALARLAAPAGTAVPAAPEQLEDETAESAAPSPKRHWAIRFSPKANMAQRGNDPYRILRELSDLGEMTATPAFDPLPDPSDYAPTDLYLAWTIDLVTEEPEERIREVFEWVEFDCELEIELATQPIASEAASNPKDTSPAPPDPAAESAKRSSAPPRGDKEAASMRVATDKLDRILDLVGELVITQSMLSSAANDQDGLDPALIKQRLEELERNTRALQESVMRVRMLPISFAFGRLPRIVRDLASRFGKSVDLIVHGRDTELDKTVLDHLVDPLVHLTRNAIDHGLETPEERQAAGKPETGELRLEAFHQSGSIVVRIADDGRGINTDRVRQIAIEKGIVNEADALSEEAIHQLIFAAGFSTADTVSDVSGRGVGMDVVRRNIVELGGKVTISSERGHGSVVTIQLPLTLSILDGQLVAVGDQRFVVPISNVLETVELRRTVQSELPGLGPVAQFRGDHLRLLSMRDRLQINAPRRHGKEDLIMVVEWHGTRVGLIVDAVLGQQQVVIKSLEENYRKVPGISGATIMADGAVALILDVAAFAAESAVSRQT